MSERVAGEKWSLEQLHILAVVRPFGVNGVWQFRFKTQGHRAVLLRYTEGSR